MLVVSGRQAVQGNSSTRSPSATFRRRLYSSTDTVGDHAALMNGRPRYSEMKKMSRSRFTRRGGEMKSPSPEASLDPGPTMMPPKTENRSIMSREAKYTPTLVSRQRFLPNRPTWRFFSRSRLLP